MFDYIIIKYLYRYLIYNKSKARINEENQQKNESVCAQSGYYYKPTPTITLKGKWLEEWGFMIDTPVIVQCEGGKLTIIKQKSEEGNNQENDCSHE